MSWIEDEAKAVTQRNVDKARQEEIYQQQASGLWSGLKHYLEQHVQQINANKELVEHALAGDKLRWDDDGYTVKISKQDFPVAMYLTISYRHRYVEVERKTKTNSGDARERKERIVYDIMIVNDESLVFRDEQGGNLGVADLSQEILTPILRTHLVK